jgi:membrane AbrB-like protein
MVVAAVLNPTWLHVARMPLTWKLYAQWIVGAGVGATMSRTTLRDFRPFVVAGGLTTAFLLVSGMVSGWALAQVTSLDLITCMIGAAPGGTDNMIILADEMGGDIQLVTAMHISRMVIVMLLLPVLSRYVVRKRVPKPHGSQIGAG